jgi:hypothetical protein
VEEKFSIETHWNSLRIYKDMYALCNQELREALYWMWHVTGGGWAFVENVGSSGEAVVEGSVGGGGRWAKEGRVVVDEIEVDGIE